MMKNRILNLIALLPLMALMTACQLSYQTEAEETITPLPVVSAAQTNTPNVAPPAASTATRGPTLTSIPPVVNTSVPLPACKPRTDWLTYTVQQGDTLSAIARRTNSTTNDLTNGNCLSNPNAISAGQVLYVPSAPVPPTLTAAPPPSNPQNPPSPTGCQGQILRTVGLRAGPGENYGPVTQVAAGDYYPVVERSGTGWYRILVGGVNQNTWVWAALLALDQNCGSAAAIPMNSAGTITGTKTFTDDVNRLAFDYPAAWYAVFNNDGLPGGMVGTFTWDMMPPSALAWSTEMVIVAYVIYPDGLPNGVTDINTQAQMDVGNVRAQNNRIGVLRDPAPITIGGLTGVTYELSGPGVGKVYYFNINGKVAQFTITGNYSMGEPVLNTLRQI